MPDNQSVADFDQKIIQSDSDKDLFCVTAVVTMIVMAVWEVTLQSYSHHSEVVEQLDHMKDMLISCYIR